MNQFTKVLAAGVFAWVSGGAAKPHRLNRRAFGSCRIARLDRLSGDRYRRYMPQSIFIFDFGTNEEAAQQARHKIDGWKQGFRLGDKMKLKFEREARAAKEGGEDSGAPKPGKKSSSKKSEQKGQDGEPASRVKLLLRLDFSDHEKLTYQRWIDRIPNEEPFKSAKPETVRSGDPEHAKVAELFDSLD
jgi:hypothetical protein